MRKTTSIALALAVAGVARGVMAQSVTGNLTTTGVNYGSTPLTIQTINTGFGDDTAGDGNSSSGSELDAAYATISSGNLYVLLTGNFQNNGNHVDLFIDDGRAGGTNTLMAGNSGFLNSMNGSIFSPGFNATYCLDANDYQGTLYLDQYDFVKKAGNYLGAVPLSGGIGASQNVGGIAEALNNTNAAGVNGTTGTAADPVAAAAVSTGIEFGIPLASLGSPTGTIKILADVNGGGDGYLSNQFLPGLAVGTGNLGGKGTAYDGPGGGGTFNLSSTSNLWFSVSVTSVPNGIWLPTGDGSWGTTANWSNNVIPANPGDSANFTNATASATVTLDGNRTVGTLAFNSDNNYTIAAGTGGSLTMDNGASTANIQDFGGDHTIAANVVLNSNTLADVVNHGDFLTFSGNISGPGQLSVDNLGGSAGGQFSPSAIILSGNNSFGGGVFIKGGNLQLGSATALPVGTAITFDASDVPDPVLDLNGFGALLGSITTLTSSQTQSVGASDQIINSANSGSATITYAGSNSSISTFMGSISDGNGSVTSLHVASGSLSLIGNSSYSGATIIDGGATLSVTSVAPPGMIPGAGLPQNSSVANNGSLNISGAMSTLSTVAGTGNLTVSGNVTVTATTISQNSLTINDTSHVFINSGGNTVTLAGLTVGDNSSASTAQIDLNDGSMLLSYTGSSPISTIRGLLFEGFNSGTWDGNGIASTAAHNDSAMQHALGYADLADISRAGLAIGGGTIEVKYTFYGDNNLDGVVDSSDFKDFLDGFASGGSTWFQGDYNYDGTVDLGNDFNLFLVSFLENGGSVGTLVGDIEDSSLSAAQKATLLAVVPEPSSITLLALGAGALATRRRRK